MARDFDPEKNERNLRERGLSLAVGFEVLAGRVAEFEDTRFDYGERRLVCFGVVTGRLHVCVYIVRDDGPRMISVRKANERERKRYGGETDGS